MLRALAVVLLLAGPVLAGPASWTAYRHGPNEGQPPTPATPTGNLPDLVVIAGPLLSYVFGSAAVHPFCKDQDGSATNASVTWYTLKFTGADDATEHRWKIITDVGGFGLGMASSDIDGSSWGESIQIVRFSGDNKNVGAGQLAVEKGASATLAFRLPPGIGVTFAKDRRQSGEDDYEVDSPKTTQGSGKACRVRVHTASKCRISAGCTVGLAHCMIRGELHGDLEMQGSCRIGELRVTDTLRIVEHLGNPRISIVTEPTGGLETSENEHPTDTPTDAERNGEEEEPSVEAGDLPDEEEEEEAQAEGGDDPETGGDEEPPTDTGGE